MKYQGKFSKQQHVCFLSRFIRIEPSYKDVFSEFASISSSFYSFLLVHSDAYFHPLTPSNSNSVVAAQICFVSRGGRGEGRYCLPPNTKNILLASISLCHFAGPHHTNFFFPQAGLPIVTAVSRSGTMLLACCQASHAELGTFGIF